jgi:transposase-like protein
LAGQEKDKNMIDRMELLRMAMEKEADPAKALRLAQDMAAFVQGESDAPVAAPSHQPKAAPVAPAEPIAAVVRGTGSRKGMHWTEHEKQRAAALLDQGVSYAEVGRLMNRTARAVQTARGKGLLPVKTHTMNTVNQLSGALSALKQGHLVSAEKQASILKVPRQ